MSKIETLEKVIMAQAVAMEKALLIMRPNPPVPWPDYCAAASTLRAGIDEANAILKGDGHDQAVRLGR
jgi:hypothetical protein